MIDLLLQRPTSSDDKYSRGVIGFITGSEEYAGAAILGTTAAIRTGVGMVRYVGPRSVSQLVLESRPEVVLGLGKAQAWILGSGVSKQSIEQHAQIAQLIDDSKAEILIIDAGALEHIATSFVAGARTILTPHRGEAVRLLERLSGESAAGVEGSELAEAVQKVTGCTVVLKGSKTVIASEAGVLECAEAPAELATAGTGDVLAGIMGALAAINFDEVASGKAQLTDIAEAAILVHTRAAEILVAKGPIAALDLANAVSQALVSLRN